MQIDDLTIEVRDRNLRRLGQLPLGEGKYELRPNFCNVGTWKVTLSPDVALVDHLRQPGAGIVVTGPDGRELMSGPMTTAGESASSTNPEGMVEIQGVTDDIVLRDALAWPVPTSATMEGQGESAHDIRSGPVESVMHAYVRANIGPDATPERRNPHLTMGVDLARGPSVTKRARFPILGELLYSMVGLADVGFRVIQRGEVLVFETYEVRDLSKAVRLDLDNGTLASYKAEIGGAAVTHVIVAGQEEGVDRQLIERTSEESLAQAALWGRRIERFLDQRQTDDLDELAQAGDELLATEGTGLGIVQLTPSSEVTMRFGVDWNLGDLVTAVIDAPDPEVDAVVTGAVILIDTNGVRVGATLGASRGGEDVGRNFERRIGQLERNAELTKTFDAGAIVSGTLPIARGGTGATTADAARQALGAAPDPRISPIPASAGPSNYPQGLSHFVVASGAGWPTDHGTVLTVRETDVRTWQQFVAKTTSQMWVRSSTDGNKWGPWRAMLSAASGYVSVSFSNRTSYTMNVTLPAGLFYNTPVVTTNISTGAGSAAQYDSRAISTTASSFTLFIYDGTAQNRTTSWSDIAVGWVAMEGQ